MSNSTNSALFTPTKGEGKPTGCTQEATHCTQNQVGALNSYTFAQLQVGQSESFSAVVAEESMQLFCKLTGDISPIHIQNDAAIARGHKGRVVYGMLGASFFSTLAGVYLPGQHCLLHSVEAKFIKPIYIGDELCISGTVSEKNETFNTITIKAAITNQHGEKVTRGVIKAGVAV